MISAIVGLERTLQYIKKSSLLIALRAVLVAGNVLVPRAAETGLQVSQQ